MKVKRKTERDYIAEIASLKEDVRRTREVGGIAMRDALKLAALVDAVCHAASAAEAFIGAGLPDRAQDVLSIMKTAHIDSLRARVAREPGGTLHKGDPGDPR